MTEPSARPSHSDTSIYDVIIAGAGPVGLFLACELRLANLSVLVLEQLEDPHSPLKRLPFGLRGLWGSSIEAFYRRGLLEQIAAHAQTGGPSRPQPASTTSGAERSGPAGHFAGIQFDHGDIDCSRWTYRLPGPADTQLGSAMEDLERVLAAHAISLGVEIRRGDGVEGFEISSDELTLECAGRRFRARFLVGCDGGRSTVRKQGGFEFVGTDPELTGYSIQVDIADADKAKLPIGRHSTPSGTFTQWQPGVIGLVDFDGGALHRTVPITLEHMQGVLRRVSGTDVTLDALHVASTWTDRSKQATTYRKGRVFLAGDAAHIHSPLGGQGLNLGLGDAMNLGWKLAAVLRSDGPDTWKEGLLDSYTTERHPVGARILEWTRAQVALMRPSSRALQAVVRDLIATRDGATYFAERVWNVSLRYDLGDAHPLVGRSCPDFELEDGTKIGMLLRNGNGLLLDFDRQLRALDGVWGERVRYVANDVTDRLGLSALLVRPDGFVAWASDTTPHVDEVTRAADRWCASREQRSIHGLTSGAGA